jgi:hypothetical protein
LAHNPHALVKIIKPNGAKAPSFNNYIGEFMIDKLIREAYWQSMQAFLSAEVDSYTDWHPVFGIL